MSDRRRAAVVLVLALLPASVGACSTPDTESAPSPPPTSAPPVTPPTGAASEPPPSDTDSALTTNAESAPTTAPPPRPELEVTIAATGDMLAHAAVNASASAYAGGGVGAYNYAPMFADVAPLLSGADLTICHLETPLSLDNSGLTAPGTLTFNTPHQLADALVGAGIDGCDFASNHTMDRGVLGLSDTEEAMREAGLGYAGPTAHEERAGTAEVYEVPHDGAPDGIARIAHLAYTYTFPNDGSPTTTIPAEAPWLAKASWPVLGAEGILEQARAARQEGADFVVVSMHWGQEYQATPTSDQTELAAALLGSDDVDLILGTHVHVIQPCEQIAGRHVIYGMGNFLSNQSPQTSAALLPETQEGMVAQFTLHRDEDGTVTTEMTYHPTRVEISPQGQPSHVVRLVSRETSPETWARTTRTVDLLGGCGAGPISPAG